jgi:hypothetical protein
MRPICKECNIRACAINYHKDDRVYYRKKCEQCLKLHKPVKPSWHLAGYKPKRKCEYCNFKPIYREQVTVVHIDGNLTNVSRDNLKTVCLNCCVEISKNGWYPGDLTPD